MRGRTICLPIEDESSKKFEPVVHVKFPLHSFLASSESLAPKRFQIIEGLSHEVFAALDYSKIDCEAPAVLIELDVESFIVNSILNPSKRRKLSHESELKKPWDHDALQLLSHQVIGQFARDIKEGHHLFV